MCQPDLWRTALRAMTRSALLLPEGETLTLFATTNLKLAEECELELRGLIIATRFELETQGCVLTNREIAKEDELEFATVQQGDRWLVLVTREERS